MVGYFFIYCAVMLLDISFLTVLEPWSPVLPEYMVSGYLLGASALGGLIFALLFQTIIFSTRRRSVEIAWNGMMVLGLVIHLAIIPSPPLALLIFMVSYLALMGLLRKTIIRSAVLRCYKAEFPERARTFQAQVDREAKKLHPENAARYQGP